MRQDNTPRGEIICDVCGEQIERDALDLHDRIIAVDGDGNDIVERFFDCPRCDHHYTVTVIDRNMRLMIQRRQQLRRKINAELKRGGRGQALQKLLDEDKSLLDDLKIRADALKERLQEGEFENGTEPV